MKGTSTLLFFFSGLLGAFVFWTACNPIKVVTQAHPGVDISLYPTYGFRLADVQNQRDKVTNEINVLVLKEAIRKELNGRGYVESEDPALEIFMYIVGAKTRMENQERVYHPNGGWYSNEQVTWEYTQGNLLLEFIDPRLRELIWQGQASAIAEERQEDIEKQISKAVKKLFSHYPQAAIAGRNP